jgi:hypothetical protein
MEKTKTEENRTAYDEFLVRLDRQMREAFGMPPQPSGGDEPQTFPAAEKPSA